LTSRAACLVLCLGSLRAEQLPVRIYTTADGLAGNTIDRIVTDSHGFLWFCTREGISRFDGYQFHNFGVTQGLPAGATDLLEAADGDYWIATRSGLARFHPASPNPVFKIYYPRDPKQPPGLTRSPRTRPAESGSAPKADCTTSIGHRAIGSSVSVEIGMPSQDWEDTIVNALVVDRGGTLWAGTMSGLYRRFPDGRCEHTQGGLSQPSGQHLAARPPGADLGGNAARALPDFRRTAAWQGRNGRMLVPRKGSWRRRRLNRCSNPRMVRYGSPPIAGLAVYRVFNGREGFDRFTARNGLPGYGGISALGEDRAGNLWMGAQGAIRMARGGFPHLHAARWLGHR
jgi:hypothetical protein